MSSLKIYFQMDFEPHITLNPRFDHFCFFFPFLNKTAETDGIFLTRSPTQGITFKKIDKNTSPGFWHISHTNRFLKVQ